MILEIFKQVKYLYLQKVKDIESKEFRTGYAKCYYVFKELFESTDQIKLEKDYKKILGMAQKQELLLQHYMDVEERTNSKMLEALALVESTSQRDIRRAVRWKIHYILKNVDKSSLDKVKELTELTNNWNE